MTMLTLAMSKNRIHNKMQATKNPSPRDGFFYALPVNNQFLLIL